mgnify:CR=1 FL=1
MAGKTINTSTKVSRAKVVNKNFASGMKGSSGRFKNVSRNSFAGTSVDKVGVSASDVGLAIKILGIIFLMIVVSLLIQRFNGKSDSIPSFTSLFNFLSEFQAPATIPYISLVGNNLGDWGILNGIRDFFSTIIGTLNITIFFINGLGSVVQYIVVFFRWLFVF